MMIDSNLFCLPMPLVPALKDYAWGMERNDCLVARLGAAASLGKKNFGEVWFGNHPSGPASILIGGVSYSLEEVARRYPNELFGTPHGYMRFQGKVLSVGQPLSVQYHPAAERAVWLRANKPEHYPDAFAKNEAGLALRPTSLLYGFREQFVTVPPELVDLLGPAAAGDPEMVTLRLLSLNESDINAACRKLYERLRRESVASFLSPEDQWALRFAEHYPEGDVGVFWLYLLNLIHLAPGESIAIPVGRIHAYLSGELAEVMWPGDCVVRLACSKKFKDFAEVPFSAEFRRINPGLAVQTGSRLSDGRISHGFGSIGLQVDVFDQPGTYSLVPGGHPLILVSTGGYGRLATQSSGSVHLADFASMGAFLLAGTLAESKLELSSGSVLCYRLAA